MGGGGGGNLPGLFAKPWREIPKPKNAQKKRTIKPKNAPKKRITKNALKETPEPYTPETLDMAICDVKYERLSCRHLG